MRVSFVIRARVNDALRDLCQSSLDRGTAIDAAEVLSSADLGQVHASQELLRF